MRPRFQPPCHCCCMVVYGGCNWITAHRSDVGTWYYSWERFIPFVPVMIIPYMSINLFFVGGPFLCQSRNELRVLAQRIILCNPCCRRLLPADTHCGFRLCVRNPATGRVRFLDFYTPATSPITCFLRCTLPFAPFSLLSMPNTQKASSVWHLTLWFVLIGFSTLLTYQHHIVDIAGGFVLAAICFYLFREKNERLS